MKPKEGLQKHILWTMDGRSWIEVDGFSLEEPSEMRKRLRERQLEKGYCREIPQDKLSQFLESLK